MGVNSNQADEHGIVKCIACSKHVGVGSTQICVACDRFVCNSCATKIDHGYLCSKCK